MTEQRHVDRAVTLAEMAPHSSVTISTLAGEDGRFSPTSPLNDPPVTFLESTEAPAYLLANTKRGIGLGAKRNTVSPSKRRETIILVTGRRTLCLVGQDSADEVIEIPHSTVANATAHTGFRAHRLALQTPRNIYHLWVNRKTETELRDAATAYIADRQRDDPEEIEGDDNASRVMYRGRPVKPTAESDGVTVPDDEKQTVMYRGTPVDAE